MSPPLSFEPLPDEPWDVLIVGTGLKQSLLACALARANKKVLQLDHNTYYGSSETCFANLLECDEWVHQVNTTSSTSHHKLPFSHAQIWKDDSYFPQQDGFKAGRGYTLTLAPSVIYWHDRLLEILRKADMTGGFVWQAVGAWWVYEDGEDEGEEEKRSGKGLLGEVVAGVGVKVVKAGMKAKGGWNKGRKAKKDNEGSSSSSPLTKGEGESSSVSQSLESSTTSTSATTLRTIPSAPASKNTPILKETPCTFEDIAWDSSLTDLHRTTLASFLRHLQSTADLSSTNEEETTLHTFLTTTYPLPTRLINHIHALTLIQSPPQQTPLSSALSNLKTHLTSLGKIPDARSASALLISYGGLAEMCQVFSRGAAVAGAINVLSRGVESLKLSENGGNTWEAVLSTNETIKVPWIVGGRWDLPMGRYDESFSLLKKKRVAKGVYVVDHALEVLFKPKYPDERIAPGGCIVVVYERDGKGNRRRRPVYIHARASSHGECPAGKSLLYAGVDIDCSEGGDEEEEEVLVERAYKVLDQAVEKVLSRIGVGELMVDNATATTTTGQSISTPTPALITEVNPEIPTTTPKIIFKIKYTQTAYLSSPHSQPQTSDNLRTLNDLPLELSLHGEDIIEEVVGVFEDILGLERGLGVGGGGGGEEGEERQGEGMFLMVGEEVRKLMREMEEGE